MTDETAAGGAAEKRTYTVFGHWKTERQARITIEAASPAEALRFAREAEDEWIGDNEELDNSDGPTEYEVHEGEGYSEPVLVEPSQEQRLQDAAPKLLAALKGVVAVADRRTVEFDAARAAIAEAEAAGVVAKAEHPHTALLRRVGALLVQHIEGDEQDLDLIADEITEAVGQPAEDDDEISCPVGDPDCLGGEGDCHDACEAPAGDDDEAENDRLLQAEDERLEQIERDYLDGECTLSGNYFTRG